MKSSKDTIGSVFNIQSYSIHDGPGIRTTVFLKGCPLHCIWCQNPESQPIKPVLMYFANKCKNCGLCASICPQKAINISDTGEPCTDRTLCVNCGLCSTVCKAGARSMAGRDMSVSSIIEIVLKDKIFYDNSGGGITISGGEPLYQPDFTLQILKESKAAGLHTAVETTCFASQDTLQKTLESCDLCICDIKHIDSQRHLELTGVPNNVILDNIRFLSQKMKKEVIIRTPVIPGCNDTEDNIRGIAEYIVKNVGPDTFYHLLPYNRLSVSKWENLEQDYELSDLFPPPEERMLHLQQIAQSAGLTNVKIGGS